MDRIVWFRSCPVEDALQQRWSSMGVTLHCVPLFRFTFHPVDVQQQWDVAVVTSQQVEHAVAHYGCSLAKEWFAVGPATAQCLLKYGIHAKVPKEYSISGLMDQYQERLRGKNIAVLTGHPFQADKAAQMGLMSRKMAHYVCYQRIQNPDASWWQWVTPRTLIVVTSNASAKYIFYLFEKQSNITKDDVRFMACSPSIFSALSEWGATSILKAQSPFEQDVWAVWEQEYGTTKTRS